MEDPVYPYNISAAFGKGGDDLKTITDVFPKIAKEKTDIEKPFLQRQFLCRVDVCN